MVKEENNSNRSAGSKSPVREVDNTLTKEGVSIPQLRAALNGRLITPGDPSYDQMRTVFLGGVDRRPAAIVRARDANDISYVVSLARQTGMELAIRSGGHSSAGHSVTDGGI